MFDADKTRMIGLP